MSLCTNKIENCTRIIPDCITANALCAYLKGLFLGILMVVQGTLEKRGIGKTHRHIIYTFSTKLKETYASKWKDKASYVNFHIIGFKINTSPPLRGCFISSVAG